MRKAATTPGRVVDKVKCLPGKIQFSTSIMSKGVILAAIDGSQNSLLAAGLAARLASLLGTHLGLIHVLDEPVVGFWGGLAARMKSDIRQQAEATLTTFAQKVTASCGVVPEFFIEDGLPEDVIPLVVEARAGAMMLVLGRIGLDGERRAHLRQRTIGHVTDKLLHHLDIPVLIVPADIDPSQICEAAGALLSAS